MGLWWEGGTRFTKMLNHCKMMQLPSGKSSIGKVANQFDNFSKAFTACNRASIYRVGRRKLWKCSDDPQRWFFFYLSRDRSLSWHGVNRRVGISFVELPAWVSFLLCSTSNECESCLLLPQKTHEHGGETSEKTLPFPPPPFFLTHTHTLNILKTEMDYLKVLQQKWLVKKVVLCTQALGSILGGYIL